MSESLGCAADGLIRDPFKFVKDTANSLYDAGAFLGQAAMFAVNDPHSFIETTRQIVIDTRDTFDQLPLEQKVSVASKLVTKFLLLGTVGGQAGKVVGECAKFLSKTASIQGTILGKKGVSFIDSSKSNATEKIKRFENDADIVDEVKEILE